MLSNITALFKARRDPALAAKLAREIVVDGAIDRATWPLAIAKFWMGLALFGLTLLAGLIIMGAMATSKWVALPAILPLGMIYLIIRLWQGLDRGKARVVALAKAQAEAAHQLLEARFSANETPTDKSPT